MLNKGKLIDRVVNIDVKVFIVGDLLIYQQLGNIANG